MEMAFANFESMVLISFGILARPQGFDCAAQNDIFDLLIGN
jgi:hypothetical protein